jgi:SAM-dependent methyltransferase
MLNILLVNPKSEDAKCAPGNLAILATIATKLGHRVLVVDLNKEHLYRTQFFDVVGITGMVSQKSEIVKFANSFRLTTEEEEKEFVTSTVIAVGSWAHLNPVEALLSTSAIKYVCIGEDEKVWKEFLQKYPHVKGIEGLGYRDNYDRIFLNRQKTHITNLDLNIGCGDKPCNIGIDIRKTKFTTVQASCEKLPFQNNVFDKVSARMLLEHLGNPVVALEEVKRVLKNEGLFCAIVPKDSKMTIYKLKLIFLLKLKECVNVQNDLKKGEHKVQFSVSGSEEMLKMSGFRNVKVFTKFIFPFVDGEIVMEGRI